MYIWNNAWVCAPEFLEIKPRNILCKEGAEVFSEHPAELLNHHTVFRKKVYIKEKFNAAKLYISADDYYMLYINGKFVTQGPANSYYFCYNYNVVDVTEFLNSGENTIFVHVLYQGLLNRAFSSADYRQGMIADLTVDGEQILDNEWKYSYAKEFVSKDYVGFRTQFYDIINNNLAEEDREMPDFDDSNWKIAPVNYKDDHILVKQETPNVVCEKVLPEKITETEKGCILDFGRELTGVFSAYFYGKKNQEVRILLGEEMENGAVRFNMRCSCDYSDKLILREGRNRFLPFEYKTFRYVELIIPHGVEVGEMCVYYRHYPFENIRKPKIENKLLSDIWDICKNAVINCSQDGYLDCPSREKGQYLGDLTVIAHSHICLSGDTRLLKKALKDFASSSEICDGLMSVVPGSHMQEVADFSLLYPYQVYLYYKYSGDKEFVKTLIPVIDNLLKYFDKYSPNGMLIESVTEKWNLVDWPESARDNYDFDLSRPVGKGYHNVINALYCGAYKYAEMLKACLGIEYEPRYEKIKECFNETFYDREKGLYVDCEKSQHNSLHSNVYPLFFDIAPDNNKICEFVKKKGFKCSPYTAYYVLLALGKNGETELMKELLFDKSEHSWYNMLREGATTTFEAWGKEQKWNTSLCHAWASAPIVAIYEFPQILCSETK